MARMLSLHLLLLFCAPAAFAQTFYKITSLSGTQNLGGKTVTITSTGVPGATAGANSICGLMEYRLQYSTSGNTNFTYNFSSPVYRIKWITAGIDSMFNSYDEISFIVNGTFYPLSSNEVSTPANSCPYTGGNTGWVPQVINGKLTGSSVPLYNSYTQVDLQLGTPINSVQVLYSGTNGFIYSIYFADTGTYVQQPYIDTVKCPGDSLYLAYGTTAPFLTGNSFTAQLSDAAGSFTSAVNIGSFSGTGAGAIPCKMPQKTPAGTGYRLRVVSSNPVRTGSDNGVNIRIKAGPSSAPVAGSNSPLCAGATLNLTSTNAGSGLSYNWIGPGSFSNGTQNPNIPNATTGASGDYIVTAINSLTGCLAKDTVTVLVKPVPTAPTAGSNSPVCSGNSLDLNATSITPGVSYSWAGPGGYNSTQQNPTRPGATVAMNGNYNVTAILNGCSSTPAVTPATVNQTPAVPIAGNNGPLCAGAQLNLTAVSTAGATYDWQGPGGYSSTAQNPVVAAATTANAGNYNVTAALNGCTSAPGNTTVAINITTTGGAYASPNDTTCPGGTVTFVAMPQNAGPSPSFQWCKNGTDIPGATNKVYTTNSLVDGDSVYCRMTVTGVCAATLTIYTNGIKMRMLPGYTYTPQVIISAVPALPIPNQPVIFNAASPNGGPTPQLQWRRHGVDVPGAVNATFSVSDLIRGEEVSCTITTNDICASPNTGISNIIMADFPVGISNISKGGIHIYPNPLTDKLIIEGTAAGTVITLYDITGRQLQSTTATGNKTELNTANLPAGSYLLEIITSPWGRPGGASDGNKETIKLQKY